MSLSPVIVKVVQEYVQLGKLFTAHDVTLDVRSRGHKAGHTEVRDAVHDLYQRGFMGIDYTRTQIPVPGGTPWLYLRQVDDASDYQNVRGGTNPVTPTVITVPAFNSVDVDDDEELSDDDDDDDDHHVQIPSNLISSVGGIAIGQKPVAVIHKHHNHNKPGVQVGRCVDGRGTLSIPSSLIRGIGLKAGDKVFAVANGNSVEISSQKVAAAIPDKIFVKYTVDTHDQVRVTQGLLTRAGLGGSQYDIDHSKNKITVKLHK